ncbi:MAG TPA: PQQ-dependent sugar dehydrogenase [Actinomycetes bacterium]|nr:PQQ-dependent sugar dehydrogenase [Actinomycetes bacterium]
MAHAQGVPHAGYSLSVVADGVYEPHALRLAPGGRLFLLQQTGKVRIVRHGRLLKKPALRLSDTSLVSLKNSAGLLSIAFPPGFAKATTQHVYLLYTHTPTVDYPYRHNVVSRWTINGNVIDPAGEQILIHLDELKTGTGAFATEHYGGDMEFGSDGKLYVTTGDLGTASNGQQLDTRSGKVLRYNRDGSIPSSNPFYATATGENRAIWDYGFRNPFKLAKDRLTGRLVLGDVGSSKFEEVDVLPPGVGGLNYGWALAEGYTPSDPSLVSPVLAYPHSSTTSSLFGCAVIGGDIYRPHTSTFPGIDGRFLFADLCQGWLRTVDPVTGHVGRRLVTGLSSPVDVAVSGNGSVWILQRHMTDTGPGGLLRLDYVG